MSESSAESRPSRQELVVPPPRGGTLPAVAGALVCAAAGFGLVWGLGIGRSPEPPASEPEVPAVADHDAESPHDPGGEGQATAAPAFRQPPDMLPLADDALPIDRAPLPDPWPRQAARSLPEDARPLETQPPQPASLDLPDPAPLIGEPPLASRDGPQAVAGGVMPTVSEVVDVAADEPRADADHRPDADSQAASAGEPSAPVHDASTARASPAGEPAALPADAPLPEERLPEDPGDMAAAPEPPPMPPATPPVAAAFGAAPTTFGNAPPVPPLPPQPRSATDHTVPAPLPAAPAAAAPAAPPAPAPPDPAAFARRAVPAATGGSPFASAPPMLADGVTENETATPDPVARLAPGPGQGRPGPLQLEGIQTPQVAVEKRGPREISVGKPARYEIVVRNVGSATAHQVVLQDAVPQGTTLVATTPPASPVAQASGPADGTLVWALGSLPPGGQAVVTMEVMPQVEGEIGSVASVSFRTDASVRSRATKPDLRIECASPEPVLIGRDLQVTITVTNPGTGAATGVVLEGFLPENVSHRSGRELEFDVGQLRPGESRTIDLVLGTRGPGVHAAELVVRADGGIEVKHQVPIEVTAPTLELAIDMPLRRFLQRPATCSIAMVNAGTAPARSIELAVQLPPGLKFVKANNAGWHDDRANRVLWNLEELPAGETGTVQVVVMPVDLGPQRINAAARSADGLACQAGHTCDVEGLAALSFEVLDSEDPIELDGITDYVVRVGNQGTKPATGVRVAATLLGDIEPVEAQGPAGHRIDNLTVSFEPLAKLAPAEEAVFRIRARGRRAGDQRIQVQLTSADQAAPITKEETTRVYADR